MADNKVVNKIQPAAAAASPPPPVAVMPADNNRTTPPPVADRILLTVCLWALVNASVLAAVAVIANRTPCTKNSSSIERESATTRCVALTDAAAAVLSALLYGELWCCAAAALAASLHMLLTQVRTMTTSCTSRWAAAAVDALAWVALAATAGVHCTEVASGRIGLAAHPGPGDTYFFIDVVLASVCLPVDLLAGLLFCSPRRRQLGEQGDDGERV